MAKTTKREQAQMFADQIANVLGDNLRSLIMFGSAVRGGFGPGHAEVNLLLIVDDASMSALRPIGRAITDWVKRRFPTPLIFTEREWRASTDVFPMEIEDMRDAHELLYGTDPFDGLDTSRVQLRHELEREIRGKLLQLRAEYAAVATDGKALTRLLIDSAGTFFVLMRGTVRLTWRNTGGESFGAREAGLRGRGARCVGVRLGRRQDRRPHGSSPQAV